MMTNEHIKIGSISDEKVKIFIYSSPLLRNQNSVYEAIKFRLKEKKNHVIQSKHFCLIDFFLRI